MPSGRSSMRSILPDDPQAAAVAQVDHERVPGVRLARHPPSTRRPKPTSKCAGVERSAAAASRASHSKRLERNCRFSRSHRRVKRGGEPATKRSRASRRERGGAPASPACPAPAARPGRAAPAGRAPPPRGRACPARGDRAGVRSSGSSAGSRRSTYCRRYWKPQREKVASRLAEVVDDSPRGSSFARSSPGSVAHVAVVLREAAVPTRLRRASRLCEAGRGRLDHPHRLLAALQHPLAVAFRGVEGQLQRRAHRVVLDHEALEIGGARAAGPGAPRPRRPGKARAGARGPSASRRGDRRG